MVINTYLKFNKTYIILKFLHEPNGITENLSLLITKNVQILQKTEHEKRWGKKENEKASQQSCITYTNNTQFWSKNIYTKRLNLKLEFTIRFQGCK